MPLRPWIILIGAGLAACSTEGHPLLDGDCGEYAGLGADELDLGDGITLHVTQDEEAVYVCLPLPEDSFGMMDIEIDTPELAAPLNLHISAQLGEWPLGESGPDSPNSDAWWATEGWFANTAYFNGMTDYDGQPGPRFKSAKGREVVLSKARFGRGLWELRFRISGIMVGDESRSVTYPDTGNDPFALMSD